MAEVFKVSVSAVVDELFAPVCFETAQIDEGTDPGSQVIQMVNNLLIKAVQEEASDIHIEPFQDKTQVRFRIDGILHQKFQLPKGILNPLVSRLKVMANLDITERRLPQDGRIELKLSNIDLDLRISTVPTIFGEKVVIRIFNKEQINYYTMENLDFSPENYRLVKSFLQKPHGLLLVTGPTGSGKSTTLYTALKSISSVEKNIVTVEDPVEYVLEGVNQTQINTKTGATFSTYLRSILRQDPDVIMIGEIRDLDTARIAVRAATTGHLVLSTMHTNDAPGALNRLIDMGVEPFMVVSSLLGVVAQRLVRRVCKHCRGGRQISDVRYTLPETADIQQFSDPPGCVKCSHTGYRGRIALHEVLKMTPFLQKLVLQQVSAAVLREASLKEGMIPMSRDGFNKAVQGLTTIQEVVRVCGEDNRLLKGLKAAVLRSKGGVLDGSSL
ncbi:MAG: type II/IV secretion system protein [Syntrophomonadaceae bacterium]|jgi:type IV pilus assembly protein PilB|nr:GspE/PulE family protein [Thermoanaerobacterales bacterium]NLN21564.1 type II/IV secretion system protein [Syntrophomonadaceae bacterium]